MDGLHEVSKQIELLSITIARSSMFVLMSGGLAHEHARLQVDDLPINRCVIRKLLTKVRAGM